eukprot:6431918-Amphidinium_carterae.1
MAEAGAPASKEHIFAYLFHLYWGGRQPCKPKARRQAKRQGKAARKRQGGALRAPPPGIVLRRKGAKFADRGGACSHPHAGSKRCRQRVRRPHAAGRTGPPRSPGRTWSGSRV